MGLIFFYYFSLCIIQQNVLKTKKIREEGSEKMKRKFKGIMTTNFSVANLEASNASLHAKLAALKKVCISMLNMR
jgi:hypothetical protein